MNQGAELLMPGDQDELVKGPMALGMWDRSQDCTRRAGGTWGRAKGLPRNLGSAATPVPKPPGCLCQRQSVGDTPVGLGPGTGAAQGQAGARFGMAIHGTSASPPALSPNTGFPKQNHTETHPLLLDRPFHPLRREWLGLAERLPPGPEPVSALGRDGCWGGHLRHHPRDPCAMTRAPSCTRRFQLSPGEEGRACGVLRGNRISSDSCSSGLQWICQKEATQL